MPRRSGQRRGMRHILVSFPAIFLDRPDSGRSCQQSYFGRFFIAFSNGVQSVYWPAGTLLVITPMFVSIAVSWPSHLPAVPSWYAVSSCWLLSHRVVGPCEASTFVVSLGLFRKAWVMATALLKCCF